MKKFFAFFQGRHTAFACFFAVAGTILAFKGMLTGQYVALIGALQGWVAFHSWKEDQTGKSTT